MKKNISIILKTEQDFVRHSASDYKENAPLLNSLFDSISEIYIPLLNLFEKMCAEAIPAKLGLVLPPILCELLDDIQIRKLYVEWLDKKIALGKNELERCSSNELLCARINAVIAANQAVKKDFCEKYELNVDFKYKARAGYQEGQIISQSRANGTAVTSGATITITIATAYVEENASNVDEPTDSENNN